MTTPLNQRKLQSIFKAVAAAGWPMPRTELRRDGTVIMTPCAATEPAKDAPEADASPWDREMAALDRGKVK